MGIISLLKLSATAVGVMVIVRAVMTLYQSLMGQGTKMDDLDNIRVRLSGKTVQKCVTNYLKNSKQARKAIDDAVGRVIMENALYEKMEKEIVKGCVQKLYENNQAYSFRKEIKDEIIR